MTDQPTQPQESYECPVCHEPMEAGEVCNGALNEPEHPSGVLGVVARTDGWPREIQLHVSLSGAFILPEDKRLTEPLNVRTYVLKEDRQPQEQPLASELRKCAEKFQRDRAKCRDDEKRDQASGKLEVSTRLETYQATWNYYEGLAVGYERAAKLVEERLAHSSSVPGEVTVTEEMIEATAKEMAGVLPLSHYSFDAQQRFRKGARRYLEAAFANFVDSEKEQLRAELKRFRDNCSHRNTTLNPEDGTMACDLCGVTEPDPFASEKPETSTQETG